MNIELLDLEEYLRKINQQRLKELQKEKVKIRGQKPLCEQKVDINILSRFLL